MPDSEREEPYSRAMVVMAHADDAEWTCAADHGQDVRRGLGGRSGALHRRLQGQRRP